MPRKLKQPKLSKEQIAAQMKAKAEVLYQRELASKKIFPALQNAENLVDAQQACEIMQTVMQSAMMKPYSDALVSVLKLDEELEKETKHKSYPIFKALIESLNNVKIQDAMKTLQGMGGAIDGYIRIQARNRPFSDLKVEDLIQN